MLYGTRYVDNTEIVMVLLMRVIAMDSGDDAYMLIYDHGDCGADSDGDGAGAGNGGGDGVGTGAVAALSYGLAAGAGGRLGGRFR